MKQVTYTEPYIQFIEQTLDSMKRGQLLCPQFQRPFVWKISNQISLLESIKNGLPIGSIMVWKTNNLEIEYYDEISGYTFFDKNLIDISKINSKTYILDGLQRLTTLYVALNKKENNSENLENQTSFYYDLKRKVFLSEYQIKTLNNPMLMPLNILLDNVSLLKFQRSLYNFVLSEEELDELVNEIDEISAAFRQYKIPIIPVVTDDISIATNSFKRINSEGVKVSDLEMIHALTWKKEYDFNSEVERLKIKELDSLEWGDIPLDVIIKTIKLMLDKNIYKTDPVDLSKSIIEKPEIISDAIMYLKKAIYFVINYFHIPSYIFIPYSLQLVILAKFIRYSELNCTKLNVNLVSDWFWFTSYSQVFSGMSDNEFKRCIFDFEIMLNLDSPYWSNKKIKNINFSYSEKYNFRSVKTKLSVLNLARLQSVINNSNYEFYTDESFIILNKYGTDAIINLFSERELLINPFDETKVHKSLANKIIASPELDLNEFKLHYFYDNFNSKFIDGFDKSRYLFDDKAYDIEYSNEFTLDSDMFFSQRLAYLNLQESIFFKSTAQKFLDKNLFI